jgi:hypothetical protein
VSGTVWRFIFVFDLLIVQNLCGNNSIDGLRVPPKDYSLLTLTGYDAATGGSTSLPGSTVPRTIGRIDSSGNIDTSPDRLRQLK